MTLSPVFPLFLLSCLSPFQWTQDIRHVASRLPLIRWPRCTSTNFLFLYPTSSDYYAVFSSNSSFLSSSWRTCPDLVTSPSRTEVYFLLAWQSSTFHRPASISHSALIASPQHSPTPTPLASSLQIKHTPHNNQCPPPHLRPSPPTPTPSSPHCLSKECVNVLTSAFSQ